jgi:hypothetical protein
LLFEAKLVSPSVKGQKTQTFVLRAPLIDGLPKHIFRSICKRGKIISLWGTNSLRKANEKMKGEKDKEKTLQKPKKPNTKEL